MSRTPLFQMLKQSLRTAHLANARGLSAEAALAERLAAGEHRQFLRAGTVAAGGALAASTGLLGSTLRAATAAEAGSGRRLRNNPKIVIVGAGIAGLHAAWRLRKRGLGSTIYEASTRTGGRMFTATGLLGPGLTTKHRDAAASAWGYGDSLPGHSVGKDYFGARWYDSSTARWLSEEPLGLDGPNMYNYLGGDAQGSVDLSGLITCAGSIKVTYFDDPIGNKDNKLQNGDVAVEQRRATEGNPKTPNPGGPWLPNGTRGVIYVGGKIMDVRVADSGAGWQTRAKNGKVPPFAPRNWVDVWVPKVNKDHGMDDAEFVFEYDGDTCPEGFDEVPGGS